MNRKRNYLVFKLSEGYGTDRELKWRPRYFSRQGLVHYLAVNVLYGNGSVIYNVVNVMYATSVNKRYIRDDNSLFGYRVVYDYKYHIARQCGNELITVSVESLMHEISLEVEKVVKRKTDIAKSSAARIRCETYEFRRGPVAHTSKHRYRYNFYRRPQLHQVQTVAEQYRGTEFNWSKYRVVNTPCWDDRPRHIDKSWKTSCKVKKQWMKHLNKHIDNMCI